MQVRSLGWEDPLAEGVAAHSSLLAQRIQRSLAGYKGAAESWTGLKQISTQIHNHPQMSGGDKY